MVRALAIEGGVGRAVLDGRRAMGARSGGSDELLTDALAGYARALYFAGDLGDARLTALRVLEHPDAETSTHRAFAVARSTLALVAVERGRLAAARGHAEKAKAAVGGIGTEQKLAWR